MIETYQLIEDNTDFEFPVDSSTRCTEILLCEMNFFRAIRRSIRRPFPVTPRLISSWLFGCSLLISRESCLFPRTGKSCRASELSANMESYIILSLNIDVVVRRRVLRLFAITETAK